MKRIKIGIIGCGNICSIYFENLKKFKNTEVAACADIISERAQQKAKEFKVPKACSVKELLADPEIKIVVNLTIPKVHYRVAKDAIRAGKSVYNEKPLTISRADGKKLLQAAKRRNLHVGCAPDTFLGAGIQTALKLIKDGTIGKPVGATAFMMCHGHESWHPAPEFYYKAGGGPMFDMGPYYVTALVALMGPVKRVTGSTAVSFRQRTITSKPLYGKTIRVDVPTHVTGILDFAQGGIGTITTSFDVWGAEHPWIEIYGSKGSISVPDPNTFGGTVKLKTGSKDWKNVKLSHGNAHNSRGLGVSDMAYCLGTKKLNRASGELAYHVLDIMHAIHDASKTGKHVRLKSTCKQPEAMPKRWK